MQIHMTNFSKSTWPRDILFILLYSLSIDDKNIQGMQTYLFICSLEPLEAGPPPMIFSLSNGFVSYLACMYYIPNRFPCA